MINKFILYVLGFFMDIFAVNFLIDPVVGTVFFSIFGEHEGAWSVIRIIILMLILLAVCIFVNLNDTSMLEFCQSEMAVSRKEGTKFECPKPTDFKSFLAEIFAFGALGIFMLAYITPSILIHGELIYLLFAFLIISSVVVCFFFLNRRIAAERINEYVEKYSEKTSEKEEELS